MSTIWSDAETRELVTLWPTASAAQIAKRLHRPIGAITGKASRLRRDGVLPAGGEKHFAVSQWWARSPARASQVRTSPQVPQMRHLKSAPVVDDALDMRPYSLLELDDSRCRWPLGEAEAVATMLCGGDAVPGRRFARTTCGERVARAARRSDRCYSRRHAAFHPTPPRRGVCRPHP